MDPCSLLRSSLSHEVSLHAAAVDATRRSHLGQASLQAAAGEATSPKLISRQASWLAAVLRCATNLVIDVLRCGAVIALGQASLQAEAGPAAMALAGRLLDETAS